MDMVQIIVSLNLSNPREVMLWEHADTFHGLTLGIWDFIQDAKHLKNGDEIVNRLYKHLENNGIDYTEIYRPKAQGDLIIHRRETAEVLRIKRKREARAKKEKEQNNEKQ
jgi:hypothetical protein